MFTCGLLRSNFSFAMFFLAPVTFASYFRISNLLLDLFTSRLTNNFFCDVGRRLLVMRKMHRKAAAPLRPAANVRRVPEHLRQRNLHVDDFRARARFASLQLAAPRVQI